MKPDLGQLLAREVPLPDNGAAAPGTANRPVRSTTRPVLGVEPPDGVVVGVRCQDGEVRRSTDRRRRVSRRHRGRQGSVWVANAEDNTVSRLDASSGKVIGQPVPVGEHPRAVAVAGDSVWVSNLDANTVSRLDASSGEPAAQPIPVGERPISIATRQGSVWVANADANTVSPLDASSRAAAGGG